jgi:hypothetical protein
MAGVKTQGSQIYIRTGAASSYALLRIPGVTGFTFNGQAGQKIDVTDLDSTNVESIAGLLDNGQLQLSCNHLPWNNANRDDQLTFLALANGTDTVVVIGGSDGTDTPTVHATTGVLTLAATRSWLNFNVSVGGPSDQVNGRDAYRFTYALEISGSITRTDRSS